MANILLLHSWMGNPNEDWKPWVKDELEKLGHSVSVPLLKDSNKPTVQDWTNSALENFELTEDSIVIGHSLGAVLALNLVMRSSVTINHLISVSGWDFWDWTPEHETFFNPRLDHAAIIRNSKFRTVIHGSTDPYVTKVVAGEYAQRLQAEFVLVENGGHLTTKDGYMQLPEVVDAVKRSQ